MDATEILVLIAFAALAAVGIGTNTLGAYHPLYFRGNPAPGIVRLGIIAAMGWIALVIWRFADPSVTGVYVAFYLVLGYGVVKALGQGGANALGLRTRVDAAERRNVAAAIVAAAFILSTGLVFGGSLWGEADPVGDDEGGWWIPLGFFALGWTTLLIAFELYQAREGRRIGRRLQRERSVGDARAAAFFLLASAVALTDAVSGDFWGWTHGLLTFGLLAGLLLVHEAFAAFTHEGEAGTSRGAGAEGEGGRTLEAALYALLALGVWLANRWLDMRFGGG